MTWVNSKCILIVPVPHPRASHSQNCMWVPLIQVVLKVIELTNLPSKRGPLFLTCPEWSVGMNYFSHYLLPGHLIFCSLLLVPVSPAPSHCGAPHRVWLASHLPAASIALPSSLCCCLWGGPTLEPNRESISFFLMITLWRTIAAQCCPLPSKHQSPRKPGSGWVQIQPYNTRLLTLTHPHGAPFFLSVIGFCHAIQTNRSYVCTCLTPRWYGQVTPNKPWHLERPCLLGARRNPPGSGGVVQCYIKCQSHILRSHFCRSKDRKILHDWIESWPFRLPAIYFVSKCRRW